MINRLNALPILGCIKFTVDEQNKTAELVGGDGEIWLEYKIALDDVKGFGSFCIKVGMLKKALSGLKEQPLTIANHNDLDIAMVIEHETGMFELPLDDANTYPDYAKNESLTAEWMLKGDMMKRVIKRSAPMIADDDLRPIMNGVFFEQTVNVFSVVASDGHRLVHTAITTKNTPGEFIMPKKVAKLLPTLLSGTEEVKVCVGEYQTSFEQDNMKIIFRATEGKYPNYMSVIPKVFDIEISTDRKTLVDALHNAAKFTTSSGLVKLCIEKQFMTLAGSDFDLSTSALDRITIDNPSEKEMRIDVCAKHFGILLSQITEDRIILHFIDPSRAFIITTDESSNKDEMANNVSHADAAG